MKLNLLNALIATAVLFVMASFLMGMQLSLDGTKLVVHGAAEVRWMWIGIGCVIVFFFQLLRPLLQQGLKKISGPAFVLPSFDGTTPRQKLLAALLIVAAVAWPFLVSRGTVDIATLTLIYVMLGLGLNVVVGLSGLLVLGYGGFYAIGAYTYALLNHYYGLGFWESLPLAGIVTAAFGFLLGFPVLRLRGDYLAIVTLGFGEIVRILMRNLDRPVNLTNGPKGISGIDPVSLFGLKFSGMHEWFGVRFSGLYLYYYLFAALLLAILFISLRLQNSRIGRAWTAIREDEDAARAMGINTRNFKLLAFAIGATFGGVAGALFAAFQGFVSPESFTLQESIAVLAMVVLGGMGHIPGVILGALLLAALPELLRSSMGPLQQALFGQVLIDPEIIRQLFYGLALILVMLYRPAGLWPARHIRGNAA